MTPMTTVRKTAHDHYCPECFKRKERPDWQCRGSACAPDERVKRCPDHEKTFFRGEEP